MEVHGQQRVHALQLSHLHHQRVHLLQLSIHHGGLECVLHLLLFVLLHERSFLYLERFDLFMCLLQLLYSFLQLDLNTFCRAIGIVELSFHLADRRLQLLNRVVFHSKMTAEKADLSNGIGGFGELLFKHGSALYGFFEVVFELLNLD